MYIEYLNLIVVKKAIRTGKHVFIICNRYCPSVQKRCDGLFSFSRELFITKKAFHDFTAITKVEVFSRTFKIITLVQLSLKI